MSLLGSTIEYVQHLRGRLKALQEERRQSSSSTGSAAESSPPLDARCCVGSPDDGGGVIPMVEADVRGTTVLLRVVCREKKGALITVLKELEKHGLSVVNTNVLPLAGSSLNITITARVRTLDNLLSPSVTGHRTFPWLLHDNLSLVGKIKPTSKEVRNKENNSFLNKKML